MVTAGGAPCGWTRRETGCENDVVLPGHIADSTIISCPSTTATVPADYLGLSVEWSMVQFWVGTSRTSVVGSFVNVLTSLKLNAATPGVLRFGGNSQDGYAWNPTGSTAGNSLFFGIINAGLVDAIFEVARRSGWKVTPCCTARPPGSAATTTTPGTASTIPATTAPAGTPRS